MQVVLYYNNNKEIKGEKKHLGNSVYSIKGSHHFVEVEICKCNEKGREKKFSLNIFCPVTPACVVVMHIFSIL